MRSIKYIVLSTFLAISTFCAISYTSCTKDACKAVTCINGGNCGGGNCICPKAIGGLNCEIIYRKLYANVYKGTGSDDSGTVYIDNTLSFAAGADTSYSKMQLVWNAGTKSINFGVILNANSSNGSSFTAGPTTIDTFTYVGTGVVNNISASMTITETHPNSTPIIIKLDNFVKQ